MDKLETWGSKYALVTLAAKRAKQIKSGAPPLVATDSRNPLTIALEEIAAGKITCVVSDADLIISTSIEPEVAELLAIPVEPEEDAEAEELLATGSESTSLDEEEEEEAEEAEEEEEHEVEEEEDEEEHDEDWVAGLDEELADEPALAVDEGIDVDTGAAGLTEPKEEEEFSPRPRGRKPKAAPVEDEAEPSYVDAGSEDAEEEDSD